MKRILEQKFNAIGFLDSDELIKELQNYNTISDKLNYLKSIKERYYDKFQSVIEDFSKEEGIYFYTDNNRTQFWQSVFGNCSLITPLSIQEPVFERYFKNGLDNPEFTYWFLKYNSEQAFNLHINNEEFINKINSDLKTTFIEAELKQLNDFEAKAKELLLNNELDIYKFHPNNYKYTKEVVLLRVLDGNYYKNNTLIAISNFGDEVQAYYKYKLLKAYLVSEQNELPPKINALFKFINFLETNTSKFQVFVPLVNECLDISNKMDKVNPNNSFIENEKYNSLNELKNKKINEVKANVIDIVNQEAFNLKIWGIRNDCYELNLNRSSFAELQKTITRNDLPKVTKAVQSYLKFRTETNSYFLSFERMFWDLDRLLKECDTYFSGTCSAKWVTLEPKTKPIYIGSDFTDGEIDNIKKALAALHFFQITVVSDLEFDGNTYENVKQKNKDSILTPENWEQHKETFFTQRMATYKESYTLKEKIKLELKALEKLHINKTDYQILKNRYKEFLKPKQALPPQLSVKQKPELNEIKLSEKVKKHFGFFNGNCPRKHKPILKNEDFEKLIEWTIWYFENDFKVPDITEPIKVINTNKTFVQLAFKYLFKKLHKSSPYPYTLFEFYKSAFSPYSEDKKSNFVAVKNNDEVKKLMQIDY